LLSDSLAAQSEEVPELVASLRGTLASLERASRGLETAVADDWPAIASDLKATSANLSAASSRVDGWLERHEESVDRFLGEGLNDLSGLVTDLHETSEQLNRLAVRLREDPSRLIYRPQQDPVVVDP
jgi:ABC-type transporter Mla subunit MlaD